MLVVVQTYPAHFYQTLLCLKSVHRCMPLINDLVLILDDRSVLCWKSYVQDCEKAYNGLFSKIICATDIPQLRFLTRYPWLRQQTTKLLLDTVIKESQWLFLDGDIRLLKRPPVDQVPAEKRHYVGAPLQERDPRPGEMSSQILYYIRYMLGIDFRGFWDVNESDKIITASHPPVHIMRADLLSKLRSDIESRFGAPIGIIHKNLAKDTRMAASEWDLIECFRQTVMGEPANWYFGDDFCETTWSSDRELDRTWFEQQGVDINNDIWRVLPDLKYF